MAFIDGTVVNVALPALQMQLQATSAQVQWVVQAYALLLAALILVGGSLGDRYGRRRAVVGGGVFFVRGGVGRVRAGAERGAPDCGARRAGRRRRTARAG